jgi:hypothetical protein
MSKLEIQSRKSNFAQIDSINKTKDLNLIDSKIENKSINNSNRNINSNIINNCCCNSDANAINSQNFDVNYPFELEYIDPNFEYKGYYKFRYEFL